MAVVRIIVADTINQAKRKLPRWVLPSSGGGVFLHWSAPHAIYTPTMDKDVETHFPTAVGERQEAPYCARLTARRQDLARDLGAYVRLEARWSWLRLGAFGACVAVIVVVARMYGFLPAVTGAIPALIVFRFAVVRHLHWKGTRTSTERVLVVVDESLRCAVEEGKPVRNWRRPEDPDRPAAILPAALESGPTWPLSEQESDDLDFYAPPVGIFGLLNRTSTDLGARRLRDILNAPCLSAQYIRQRQEAVRWLARHDTQRIAMMASIVAFRGQSHRLDALVEHLHDGVVLHPHTAASWWIRIWSVVSGLFFALAVVQMLRAQYEWFRWIVLLIAVNLLIARLNRGMLIRLKAAALPLVRLTAVLRGLWAVAQQATESLPAEADLGVLRHRFAKVVTEAEVPWLCERLGWLALGGLARSLMNALVFYDLHVCEAIVRRLVSDRQMLLDGLAAMAEFEALASLACFAAERRGTCYPELTGETLISISDGRHPLIVPQSATSNSVCLTDARRMWVITGANAAGKSTYLRMIGVNVLLAQIGSAVPARGMALSPVRLLTDVRIRDDLARNESYFLSEVRRLRRMVADAGADTRLLGLIDEPFRGTNSSERTAAGIALAEYLLESGNVFVLATHEETLAQTAAASDVAENHHFQEHLTEQGIEFDYLLCPGPANTRTAIRILEQEQYPPSLLDRARRLMGP